MIKYVLKLVAAAALMAATLGISQAQAQARNWGPSVTIYNNSNQSLVFDLSSAYSRVGRYRVGPRQTTTLHCNCASTPHFLVQIMTANRGTKRYTLYPGLRYQLKWNSRMGLWNIFTMRAGRPPAGGGGFGPSPGGGSGFGRGVPGQPWQAGQWRGRAYINSARQFTSCKMTLRYRNGITLGFGEDRQRILYIGISRPNWRMRTGLGPPMRLMVDGRFMKDLVTEIPAGDPTTMWAKLGRDRPLRTLIMRARRITLVSFASGRKRYVFQLTNPGGTPLNRLSLCARTGM